jgi:CheY-like chemotaxis protein
MILVIEDNATYQEVAKKVLGSDKVIYTSTLSEAKTILRNLPVDAVISDLFFPEDENNGDEVKKSFIAEVNKNSEIQKAELETKLAEDEFAYDYSESIDQTNFDFAKLDESPSGLEIACLCIDKEIPFIIVSQGERHSGNLAVVRSAAQVMTRLKIMTQPFPGQPLEVSTDPLPDMLLYGGDEVDKAKEKTWIDALSAVKKIELFKKEV